MAVRLSEPTPDYILRSRPLPLTAKRMKTMEVPEWGNFFRRVRSC
jgi:hypothetical protein